VIVFQTIKETLIARAPHHGKYALTSSGGSSKSPVTAEAAAKRLVVHP
jgi:hypothetical protein